MRPFGNRYCRAGKSSAKAVLPKQQTPKYFLKRKAQSFFLLTYRMPNKILWVDDEIDSLKSQLLLLSNKGYDVHTLTNGFDAIDYVKEHPVDVVLLDESMPGLTGLETLAKIKAINATIPVVMITKNETENLMEEAIGSQISDYLIKPVNPNQVLLSLKKIIDNKRLVSEKTTSLYQQDFRNLFMALNSTPDHTEWRGDL